MQRARAMIRARSFPRVTNRFSAYAWSFRLYISRTFLTYEGTHPLLQSTAIKALARCTVLHVLNHSPHRPRCTTYRYLRLRANLSIQLCYPVMSSAMTGAGPFRLVQTSSFAKEQTNERRAARDFQRLRLSARLRKIRSEPEGIRHPPVFLMLTCINATICIQSVQPAAMLPGRYPPFQQLTTATLIIYSDPLARAKVGRE